MKHLLVIGLMLFCVMSASALDINISQEKVVEESTAQEDYLFAGKELVFSGIADDLYFFGNKLTLTGTVESGLVALGEDVTINGTVKNDAQIIAAKKAEILSSITGTLFIAGNDVVISEDAAIHGDLLAGAAKLTIDGIVDGDLRVGAGKVIINGTVTGNLYTKTGKIEFGENGKIQGNVEYSSDWEISEGDRSKVGGTIQYTEWDSDSLFNPERNEEIATWVGVVVSIIFFLSFIIAGILMLVFPAAKTLEEDRTVKRFFFTGLWGLIPFFVYPVLIILGLVLGITAPVALILILAGLPVLIFTQVIGITLTGQLFFRLFKWKKKSRYLFFLFGMVAAIISSIIPFMSGLGFIFLSALGWGKILEGLFKTEFGKQPPSAPVEA